MSYRYIAPMATQLAAEVRAKQGLPADGRGAAADMARLETAFREELAPDVPTYDVFSVQEPNFSEWTYTEGLGCFFASTQSIEINARLILEAVGWRGTVALDFAAASASLLSDKWVAKTPAVMEPAVKIFFAPGGNLNYMVDTDGVARAFDRDPSWRLKPHPVTSDDDIRQAARSFGVSRVYAQDVSGMALLRAAEAVGYTTASELGIVALLLGKPVVDFTRFESECAGRYHPIYLALRRHSRTPPGTVVNRLANCPWSGLVPLSTATDDARARFREFKKKTIRLRETYAPLTRRPQITRRADRAEGF